MEKIVVFGSSGHAKVIIDIIEKSDSYDICGFIDSFRSPGEETYGYSVLGDETQLPQLQQRHQITKGIVAIGDNYTRYKVAEKIKRISPEFIFASLVHPSSNVARGVVIAEGSVVMAGTTINSDTHIGRFCIVNTHASIDHDSRMEDFSSLAPGATTGGNVCIGEFSAVCLGASVIHGVTIGKHSVVGAGAVVLQDIADYSVVYGVPGKVIRSRKVGEKYM